MFRAHDLAGLESPGEVVSPWAGVGCVCFPRRGLLHCPLWFFGGLDLARLLLFLFVVGRRATFALLIAGEWHFEYHVAKLSLLLTFGYYFFRPWDGVAAILSDSTTSASDSISYFCLVRFRYICSLVYCVDRIPSNEINTVLKQPLGGWTVFLLYDVRRTSNLYLYLYLKYWQTRTYLVKSG